MKTLVLSIVLLALCITPSISQVYYDVSDADMTVTAEYTPEYWDRKDPVFANEATSPIAVRQMVDSKTNLINYRIFIKNTGETNLTDIALIVTPPTNVTHRGSFYFRNPTQGKVPISALVSGRDGTTKLLILNPKDLNTGELTGILVTFARNNGSDLANDKKNSVEVRATALNPSERGLFEEALKDMAIIEVIPTGSIIVTEDVTTYSIQIKNRGKTRLTGIVLGATLPENVQYKDSRYSDPQGESVLPRPSEIRNPEGTTHLSWFLGDLETGSSKSIELNVSCGDERCPDVGKDGLEASGWTSIVNKIPILITSVDYQEKKKVVAKEIPAEPEEPAIAPREIDPVSGPEEIAA